MILKEKCVSFADKYIKHAIHLNIINKHVFSSDFLPFQHLQVLHCQEAITSDRCERGG